MSFPLSTAPNAVLSSRVQLECQKQSTYSPDSWSSRVVTVDRQTGTLTVSRHRHPESVFYHSLKPSAVQTWPNFSTELIHDDFHSLEAKLTICVLGTVAAVPDFAVEGEAVALVAIPVPVSSEVPAEATENVYPPPEYTPATAAAAAPGGPAVPVGVVGKTRKEKVGKFDAWVLRLTSKASYEVALQMLGQLPDVKFSKGQSPFSCAARAKEMCFSAGQLGPLSMMTSSSSRSSKRHSNAVH